MLVVAELAVGLRDDRTLHGVLVFAGLFSSVWWAWAGFTFYANRFDTDDVVYRLAKLGAMLAVAGLAASATDATGSLAAQFGFARPPSAWCWSLYHHAYRHVVQARGLIVVYRRPERCRWLVVGRGAGVGPARYAAWVVAVAVEVAAPVVATRRSAGLPCILSTCPSGWGRRRASGSYFKDSSSEGSHHRPAGQFVRFSARPISIVRQPMLLAASVLLDPDATIRIDLHKRLFPAGHRPRRIAGFSLPWMCSADRVRESLCSGLPGGRIGRSVT